MSDELNPYASPLTPGAPVSYGGMKKPRYPWLSSALIAGMLLNVVLVAGMLVLDLYERWMESQQPGQPPPMAFALLSGFFMLVATAYWPISSLALLVYSITVDRGTSWWLQKSIVAGTMLLMWLSCCVLIVV